MNSTKSTLTIFQKAICILCVLALFLAVRFYIDNYTFNTTYYKVSYDENSDYCLATIKNVNSGRNTIGQFKIPSSDIVQEIKGKKIIQISDLHNMSYGKNNEKLISIIDSIAPDYIFFTGDMVSANQTEFEGFYSLLDALGKKYDCYYITGNHEVGLSVKRLNNLLKRVSESGVYIIENKRFEILPNVCIYGLNYDSDFYHNRREYSVEEMAKDLGTSQDDRLNILITHDPKRFDIYSQWGANLVFAGHNHGGMIRLFDRGLFSSDRELFPYYDAGLFTMGFNDTKSCLVVSKGLSRGATGFRLFNVPELVVVEF